MLYSRYEKLRSAAETEGSRGGALLKILKSPLMWSFALLCVATEIMGYRLIEMLGVDAEAVLGAFPLLSAARVVAVASILLLSLRVRSFFQQRWLYRAAYASVLFGSMVLVVARVLAMPFYVIGVGLLVMIVSTEFLWLDLFELLSRKSLGELCSHLVCAALLNAAFAPLYNLPVGTAILLCVAALLASLVLLASQTMRLPAETHWGCSSSPLRVPWSVAVGFVAVALAFGFSQSAFYAEEADHVTVIMVTKIAAALLFAMLSPSDERSFAPMFRTIAALALSAYVMFGSGMRSWFSVAVLDIGFSLFEMVGDCALITLMGRPSMNHLRAFSLFGLLTYASLALGGWVFGAIGSLQDARAVVTVLIALMLVMVATWAFNDKDLVIYFWGKTSEEVRQEASSYETGIEELASKFGLSPREREVLSLFAVGRSAVFISEQLFVSETTVRTHVKHIYRKCGVHSRQELISLIIAQGE